MDMDGSNVLFLRLRYVHDYDIKWTASIALVNRWMLDVV